MIDGEMQEKKSQIFLLHFTINHVQRDLFHLARILVRIVEERCDIKFDKGEVLRERRFFISAVGTKEASGLNGG